MCRARRAADEMIVFVGHDDKQRVVLGDAVRGEPGKEFAERGVVLLELGDVAASPGPNVPEPDRLSCASEI
jgi:hypothetical protein